MNALFKSMLPLLCVLAIACRKEQDNQTPTALPQLAETDPPIFKPVIKKVNDVVGGYYQALPSHYNETDFTYPLLLFIHGGGQFGNGSYDLPLLLNEGIPQLLDEKKFPPQFTVNGSSHSFIVLAPQFNKYPLETEIASFLDYALKSYRIDTTRIYVCGFSLGARITCDFSAAYANKIAAIVPMSGVSNFLSQEKSRSIAMANLPAWAFHNGPDVLFSAQDTKAFIDAINSYRPARISKVTIFPDSTGMLGHDAWSKATNPSYKENQMNMYEWMLQFKR